MLEFPLNRKGRLKNANLDVTFDFALPSSLEGRLGDEGNRFKTLCTKPIDAMLYVGRSRARFYWGELAPSRLGETLIVL